MTTTVKEEGTPWEIHDVVDLYWSKLASKVKSILTEKKRHSHQRTGLAKQPAVVLDRCLQKKKSRDPQLLWMKTRDMDKIDFKFLETRTRENKS